MATLTREQLQKIKEITFELNFIWLGTALDGVLADLICHAEKTIPPVSVTATGFGRGQKPPSACGGIPLTIPPYIQNNVELDPNEKFLYGLIAGQPGKEWSVYELAKLMAFSPKKVWDTVTYFTAEGFFDAKKVRNEDKSPKDGLFTVEVRL